MENAGIYETGQLGGPTDCPTLPFISAQNLLVRNYKGKKCELQFAEYVMRSSKVLSNMTIHSACSIDLKAKHQMLQKLSLCPRGCKLIFQ